MSIEKEKISGGQLAFLAVGLIQGSILLTSYIEGVIKHDAWLAVLSGFAVAVPFAFFYAALAKKFPGMNLVQIHDLIYGPYFGKTISIFYIGYLVMVLSFNIRLLGDFYVTFLMPQTPLVVFLIVLTLTCAYAVRNGIEVLARIGPLLVANAFFIIIITSLLLLKDMNFANFLPVFEAPLRKLIQGTHIVSAIPFGEIVIFLTMTAALAEPKHTTRNLLLGLALGGISFLIITLRNTAVLGDTAAILTSPSFQAARLINVRNVLTRMDILIAVGLTSMIFLKCSLFFYAAIISLSELLSLKTYLPLILPIGGITIILALISWESAGVVAKLSINTSPIFVIPFIYLFPSLSLMIAKIRNLPK